MNYHISANETEEIYTDCLRKFKRSLKKEWTNEQKRYFFSDLISKIIYEQLCERYFLAIKKEEAKNLRNMIDDFLQLAKLNEYKHFVLCQNLRLNVIEQFEKKVMLVRASKANGTAKQVATHVKGFFK